MFDLTQQRAKQEHRIHEILNSDPCVAFFAELIAIESKFLKRDSRLEHLEAMDKMKSFFESFYLKSVAAASRASEDENTAFGEGVLEKEREELSVVLNMSPSTAQRRIDNSQVAVDLLSKTILALEKAEISQAIFPMIADAANQLVNMGADKIIIEETEAKLLSFAEFHTPGEVRSKARRLIAGLDPDSFSKEVEAASASRSVRITQEVNGMATIYAYLPAIEAQFIMKKISECARRNQNIDLEHARNVAKTTSRSDSSLVNKIEKEASLGIDAYRADVLISLIAFDSTPGNVLQHNQNQTGNTSQARNTSQVGNAYHVESPANSRIEISKSVTLQITMDFETLLGLQNNPAQLQGYGPIPAEIARLLAADAKWQKFIVDPLSGLLLDYGRQIYIPPQALKDFIYARDKHCRFPGCTQGASRTDIDHVIPWEKGGTTSPDNLGLLCRRHHLMKTHEGWGLISFPDGSCEWTSPSQNKIFVPARPFREVA